LMNCGLTEQILWFDADLYHKCVDVIYLNSRSSCHQKNKTDLVSL